MIVSYRQHIFTEGTQTKDKILRLDEETNQMRIHVDLFDVLLFFKTSFPTTVFKGICLYTELFSKLSSFKVLNRLVSKSQKSWHLTSLRVSNS